MKTKSILFIHLQMTNRKKKSSEPIECTKAVLSSLVTLSSRFYSQCQVRKGRSK
jgi:hypothetical protein